MRVWVAVNNVGIMYEYPDELGHISEETLWGMININVAAVTMMTRMLINDMKARGKGAIVNLSSGSSLQPLPLMAVYSASKVIILMTDHKYISFRSVAKEGFTGNAIEFPTILSIHLILLTFFQPSFRHLGLHKKLHIID